MWRNDQLLDNGLLKTPFAAMNTLGGIKALPRDEARFGTTDETEKNR
jgi:hypothetical protein